MFHTSSKTILCTFLIAVLSFPAIAKDKPVATVNGKPISQELYEAMLKTAQKQNPQLAGNRDFFINELVTREILYQDAVKKKLEKEKEVKFVLEQIRMNTLIQANIASVSKSKPITEEMMKAEYDKTLKNASPNEYKLRHIAVKTEAEAKEVIQLLDDGAVFSDVAKDKSVSPTKSKGGDMGWRAPGVLPPVVGKEISNMEKGGHSKTALKVNDGYQIFGVEDIRKVTPPPYEEVKGQIRQVLQGQIINEYIQALRKKAKIKIN
jgi:peptidyl-prolyl cis-trans isomerase C